MASIKFLLDTHCLLWFQEDNPKIPVHVMKEIRDSRNDIFFSQVSLYEIAIKQKIGKLPDFKSETNTIYKQGLKDGFIFLTISNQHIDAYQKLPLIEKHRDPFDRLLIATAHTENAIVLTVDSNFNLYPDFIQVLW